MSKVRTFCPECNQRPVMLIDTIYGKPQFIEGDTCEQCNPEPEVVTQEEAFACRLRNEG